MARKDVFKGALEALINAPDPGQRAQSKSILQSGALGAVESGLARGLQVLDLDPAQIERSEFEDRLPYDSADLADLVASIREHGQQIPILVQRTPANGFRVIYGRRRIAAARELGQKVRALVTQMDDEQRILAQGIENTVRQDLSFVEKALFAHRLREAQVPDATIRASLNIDVGAPKATTLSTMKMVVEVLGEDLIQAIGRAPGIGRPRWRALAEALRANAAHVTGEGRARLIAALAEPQGFAAANPDDDPSDARFKRAFALITAVKPPPDRTGAGDIVQVDGAVIGVVRRSASALNLTIRAQDNPGFHAWLQDNAETLLADLHDQWRKTTRQPTQEAR